MLSQYHAIEMEEYQKGEDKGEKKSINAAPPSNCGQQSRPICHESGELTSVVFTPHSGAGSWTGASGVGWKSTFLLEGGFGPIMVGVEMILLWEIDTNLPQWDAVESEARW